LWASGRGPSTAPACSADDAEQWERQGFGPWIFSERDGARAVVACGGHVVAFTADDQRRVAARHGEGRLRRETEFEHVGLAHVLFRLRAAAW
jgi:hypothetical protein